MANVLNDIVVIVDTREQKNQHILDWFESNEIAYEISKLDSGDYSFRLPNYMELDIDRMILVEKKNSLDELAGNFTKGRERFQREFERVGPDQKIHLLVEKATFKKLLNGSYRSQFSPQSYMASIFSWSDRYGIPVWFCNTSESGEIIYNILKYGLLNYLKEL